MALKFNPFTGTFDLVGSNSGIDEDVKQEYRTLTALEASNKEIVLLEAPTTPNKTQLDIIGGSSQEYSSDFIVVGNVLSWSGLQLDTTLNEGDRIRVQYFK